MKKEERDAIVMRVCNALPRSYVNVEDTLAEVGFFDLLEAAEEVEAVDRQTQDDVLSENADGLSEEGK